MFSRGGTNIYSKLLGESFFWTSIVTERGWFSFEKQKFVDPPHGIQKNLETSKIWLLSTYIRKIRLWTNAEKLFDESSCISILRLNNIVRTLPSLVMVAVFDRSLLFLSLILNTTETIARARRPTLIDISHHCFCTMPKHLLYHYSTRSSLVVLFRTIVPPRRVFNSNSIPLLLFSGFFSLFSFDFWQNETSNFFPPRNMYIIHMSYVYVYTSGCVCVLWV